MKNHGSDVDPHAGETVVWRVLGAFLFGLIGAGIGSAIAPDGYSSRSSEYYEIISSSNAMAGAFLGALFGGGMGWLIDRAVGRSYRRRVHYRQEQNPPATDQGNRSTDDEPNWHYGG